MGASALHSEGGRLKEQADALVNSEQDISSARLLFALSYTEAWDAQNPGPIWFRSVFCFQSVSRMTEGEHMLHCQDASLSHSNLNFQAFWCFPRNVFFNYLTIFTWFPNVFSNAEHMNYSTRQKCIFFVFFSCPFFLFVNFLKFLKMFPHDTYFPAVPVVAAGANTIFLNKRS